MAAASAMKTYPLDEADEALIAAARETLLHAYHEVRHSVGAAVLAASGKVYTGVNVESCGAGPCAEPVALGAAISAGEQGLLAIVAVGGFDAPGYVLNPCGNCRQMMIDYAPDMLVIVGDEHGAHFKVRARDLLPFAYRHFDGDPP